jgi:hypothetical protein
VPLTETVSCCLGNGWRFRRSVNLPVTWTLENKVSGKVVDNEAVATSEYPIPGLQKEWPLTGGEDVYFFELASYNHHCAT